MSKEEMRDKVEALSVTILKNEKYDVEEILVNQSKVLELIDQLYEPKITSQTQAVEFLAGEYNLIEDEVDKVLLNYRKPVVPSFVAEWFEKYKSALEVNIFEEHRRIALGESPGSKFEKWFDDTSNAPIETLVKMKNGYTVEKEKKYRVKDSEGAYLQSYEVGVNNSGGTTFWTDYEESAIRFLDKDKAQLIKNITGGKVEEVNAE